jgi:uncharacterized SAM-binding protein YcdF (DUF218 family)
LIAVAVAGAMFVALSSLGGWLIVSDPVVQADAIVVIGGDHKPERIRRAVELYRQGYALVVIISAGTMVQEGAEKLPEAEVMRRQALALGLPDAAMVLETQSNSTLENARCTQAILQSRGARSILLVTSVHHSRRAAVIFREVLGSNVTVSVQPAREVAAMFDDWLLRPDEWYVVGYEYWNWAVYLREKSLGKNNRGSVCPQTVSSASIRLSSWTIAEMLCGSIVSCSSGF